MVVKALLKYSIIEWCLNSLFDTIAINFKIVKSTSSLIYCKDIKEGERYEKISDGITTWNGCTIQRLEIHYDEKTKRLKIWFKYQTHEEYGERIGGSFEKTWIDLPYYDSFMEFTP